MLLQYATHLARLHVEAGRKLIALNALSCASLNMRTPAPFYVREANLLDYIGLDDAFLELLDLPTTFPKVWSILGWHISLYHSHAISTPPTPPPDVPVPLGEQAGWHQDSGRLNQDLSGDPRPRVSLKVGFIASGASEASVIRRLSVTLGVDARGRLVDVLDTVMPVLTKAFKNELDASASAPVLARQDEGGGRVDLASDSQLVAALRAPAKGGVVRLSLYQ